VTRFAEAIKAGPKASVFRVVDSDSSDPAERCPEPMICELQALANYAEKSGQKSPSMERDITAPSLSKPIRNTQLARLSTERRELLCINH
jgi:hypothetical protein